MGVNCLHVAGKNTENSRSGGTFQFFFVLSQMRLGDINEKP